MVAVPICRIIPKSVAKSVANYLVIIEQQGVTTSLLPALPHDYFHSSWTAAPQRINVGHRTRFLSQTDPSNLESDDPTANLSASSMSSPDSALRDLPTPRRLPNALPDVLPDVLDDVLDDALPETQAHLVVLDPGDGLWEVDYRIGEGGGVRSSKDGKSGAWWWTLPPQEDEYPPVNQARCSN